MNLKQKAGLSSITVIAIILFLWVYIGKIVGYLIFLGICGLSVLFVYRKFFGPESNHDRMDT